ncbi:hypothetical protein [Streptomyces europaeiscabiei]|uniref:hypothetical protein n=1 Tax=Streptomyces europaeiscabiei TaxID=146819 RepID=UPI0029C0366B|nr:hypothetical protein [Streptomyces europaeiscabiei]
MGLPSLPRPLSLTGENFQNFQRGWPWRGCRRRATISPPRPPTPGTKRVERVEENTTADGTRRSAEQITKLGNLAPASGFIRESWVLAQILGSRRRALPGVRLRGDGFA